MIVHYTDDLELAFAIKKAIEENNGYCPCRTEKTPDTRCMCKEFRDQIARGEKCTCHCGLYVYGERSE